MNDTVTKLMWMVDELTFLAERVIDERDNADICLASINARNKQRQALQDELVRLFTPLTDEQISNVFRNASPGWLEETDTWSFKCGIKFAESRHGITGEKNEPA
mgnify:CR=1 FL=1